MAQAMIQSAAKAVMPVEQKGCADCVNINNTKNGFVDIDVTENDRLHINITIRGDMAARSTLVNVEIHDEESQTEPAEPPVDEIVDETHEECVTRGTMSCLEDDKQGKTLPTISDWFPVPVAVSPLHKFGITSRMYTDQLEGLPAIPPPVAAPWPRWNYWTRGPHPLGPHLQPYNAGGRKVSRYAGCFVEKYHNGSLKMGGSSMAREDSGTRIVSSA